MSCLAAGFSTGVTSFSPLASAPWIADSSSEVGLGSDILADVSSDTEYVFMDSRNMDTELEGV